MIQIQAGQFILNMFNVRHCNNQYFFLSGMFKRFFREIARPFQYASKAGYSETFEIGRSNIGGNITGRNSTVQLYSLDTIASSQFQIHLRGKGFTTQMVSFFYPLQHIQVGKLQSKQMKCNQTLASLEIVAVAVYNDQSHITIALLKKKYVVTFQAPQIIIHNAINYYGLGRRQTQQVSHIVTRGLSNTEISNIQQTLNQLVVSEDLANEAEKSIQKISRKPIELIKQKKEDKVSETVAINTVINIEKLQKEHTKSFQNHYSNQNSNLSQINNNVGFNYLSSNIQNMETIVHVQHIEQFIKHYLCSLQKILNPKLYNDIEIFFEGVKKAEIGKFKKKEILFSTNTNSNVCFVGAYFKRTKTDAYMCSKIVQNAFQLTPDIYVVHETESESAMWGAYSSNTQRDVFHEINREIKKEDLQLLIQSASTVLNKNSIINELK